MKDCIFCKIVRGEIPCYKIWEDEKHLAFLSPWGNTPGFSVVITKEHYGSYVFELDNKVMNNLMVASKQVAKLIDSNLEDVGRCGLMFEGFGVDHIHSKIFPMHGTSGIDGWEPIESKMTKYFEKYEGYLSSHDVQDKMSDDDLKVIADKIRGE